MDSYQKESIRRIRRNSMNVLQNLFQKGNPAEASDAPVPAQSGRDAKIIRSVASLIRGKSKLLLLESPDTMEVYKLNKPAIHSSGAENIYMPAVTAKASNLTTMRGTLSQSCPYLYNTSRLRRGSFSSVGSQKTLDNFNKQSNLKKLREAKKSNVTVTMTYLGHGLSASGSGATQDDLKVLQQVNGGENICVFKGMVTPGEQFHFVSQRHRGYPFSATMYVNGMIAARISSCCEYRYAPGFQQGKKSCFRVMWLAGGMPCYRCTSLRNKYSSCQQLNNGANQNLSLPRDRGPGNATVESCPSSPLFLPAKPEKKSVRRSRSHRKESNNQSTDSEEPAAVEAKEPLKPKRLKGQSNHKEDKTAQKTTAEGRDAKGSRVSQRSVVDASDAEDQVFCARQDQAHLKTSTPAKALQKDHQDLKNLAKVPDSLQDEDALSKQIEMKKKDPGSDGKNRNGERLRDFYEECVEMSARLEPGQNKQNRLKANILERCRLAKKLSLSNNAAGSDLELSEESDNVSHAEEEAEEEDTECQNSNKDESEKEQDLQAQLDAMMMMLKTSDEVEELVLRNTDLTDDHLLSLAQALKTSRSEVKLLNLNLNRIGPYGAMILLDLLRAKPQVKGLLLFGNQLRNHGVQSLLSGIAELQEQTKAAVIQQAVAMQAQLSPEVYNNPNFWASLKFFSLVELDIGGNGLGSEGLMVLASYMRHHSYLQYLGLAQTSSADLVAWKELFDSLKGNSSLTQIILDESNLGDPGVRLLADTLKVNVSLTQVDLDRNCISDVGGNDIMGALLCRTQFPMRHLSLEENDISAGLMSRIQQEVK